MRSLGLLLKARSAALPFSSANVCAFHPLQCSLICGLLCPLSGVKKKLLRNILGQTTLCKLSPTWFRLHLQNKMTFDFQAHACRNIHFTSEWERLIWLTSDYIYQGWGRDVLMSLTGSRAKLERNSLDSHFISNRADWASFISASCHRMFHPPDPGEQDLWNRERQLHRSVRFVLPNQEHMRAI